MARRKSPPKARPHNAAHAPASGGTIRRFRSRGVDVEIREGPRAALGGGPGVALTLDGVPVEVSIVDGEYHSHLAHMFTGFATIDALVDGLLDSEGRIWSLHGHVCDERCEAAGHHHDHAGHDHGGSHGHDHGGHDHPPAPGKDHPHHHGAVAPARGGARKRRGGRR